MKFAAILALLPSVFISAVFAAPPGVMQYQTLASPVGCGGHDLSTIGFIGSSGVRCISLAEDATSDRWLTYFAAKCTIDLYSEAGCEGTPVLNIPAPGNPGFGACREVSEGFRALSVTCTD